MSCRMGISFTERYRCTLGGHWRWMVNLLDASKTRARGTGWLIPGLELVRVSIQYQRREGCGFYIIGFRTCSTRKSTP